QILSRLAGHLDMESIVIVERAARSPEPTMPAGLEIFRAKTFGETAIHFIQLAVESESRGPPRASRLRPARRAGSAEPGIAGSSRSSAWVCWWPGSPFEA